MKAVSVAMIAKSEKMKLKKSRSPKKLYILSLSATRWFLKINSAPLLNNFLGISFPPLQKVGDYAIFLQLTKTKICHNFFTRIFHPDYQQSWIALKIFCWRKNNGFWLNLLTKTRITKRLCRNSVSWWI